MGKIRNLSRLISHGDAESRKIVPNASFVGSAPC